jgi:hypothetical protein
MRRIISLARDASLQPLSNTLWVILARILNQPPEGGHGVPVEGVQTGCCKHTDRLVPRAAPLAGPGQSLALLPFPVSPGRKRTGGLSCLTVESGSRLLADISYFRR